MKLRDEVARLKSQIVNNNAGGNIDSKYMLDKMCYLVTQQTKVCHSIFIG